MIRTDSFRSRLWKRLREVKGMAERIYYNGDIITMEQEELVEAVLVKDGVFGKIGTLEEVRREASEGVIEIDLDGKTMLSAFIDAHSHFTGYAYSLLEVSLQNAEDFHGIVKAVQTFIEKNQVPPGEWVIANGYDHNYLKEQAHPTKEVLDQAAPKNPLVVKHQSGHMGVFNTLGLQALGLTDEIKDPEGGKYGRKEGRLTGYAEENAYVPNVRKIPMVTMDKLKDAIEKAQKRYASYGISTVQEGMLVNQLADVVDFCIKGRLLMLDLVGYMDFGDGKALKERFPECIKEYYEHYKIGGYKTFLDGSPQGRTAWMLTPYEGEESGYKGYGTQTDEELKEKIKIPLQENIQLLAHCNGDAASAQYIRAYREVKEETGCNNDIRPVIIHAQLLAKEQLDEVKELGMIPSFFVAHVYHWGDIHIKNFGKKRAEQISACNSALKKGIRFTFHQDSPIIEPNMLETIWCACRRMTKSGVILGEEECIPPYEALKAVTIHAAYQYFEEDRKGSIKEGKDADYILLDKNPLKVEIDEIKKIQILETVKEGKTIYCMEKDSVAIH